MAFLHNFQPDPILAQFGIISIHAYGLIISLAVIAALIVAWRLVKRDGLEVDDLLDLAVWLIVAGIIGARIYDVLVVDWSYFSRHLIEILYIWQGGLAIHGAVIGGLAAMIIWCKLKKQNLWTWLDIVATALPLAQAIGRWGNYFNQELFGRPTDWPIGIPIAENLRPEIYKTHQYFQPAFLYESLLNFLLFVILIICWKKKVLRSGQAFAVYLIGYGLIRFVMELIRIDVTGMVFGWRVPQVVSVIIIIIGVIIFYSKRKLK